MTVVKRKRKAQSHTATGKARAIIDASTTRYPPWPIVLVSLPSRKRDRDRARGWYEHLMQHRTPEAWQPGDPPRVALLARTLAAWERETWLLSERDGGNASLSEKWRTAIGQLSRQLGLSVAVRDPRLSANDAIVRAENDPRQLELGDPDGLIARPPRSIN